jgi:hypothetical protein
MSILHLPYAPFIFETITRLLLPNTPSTKVSHLPTNSSAPFFEHCRFHLSCHQACHSSKPANMTQHKNHLLWSCLRYLF